MKHPVDDDVVHERMAAGHLRRNVRSRQRPADDDVGRGVLERRLRIDLDAESTIADQLADANAHAAGLRAHFAVDGFQFRPRFAETLRRETEQRLARGCGRLADLHATTHHAGAAGRRALIGRKRGVAFDQRDPLDRATQFLGGHLRNRDAQALSEIDLATEDRDAAVGTDREEAVDFVGIERLAERPFGGGCTLGGGAAAQREADNQCAAGLQEIATRGNHFDPAATSTALTMRWCVPQRHRLPPSACFTSSRVGRGFLPSSAAALITMPGMQ